MDNGTKKAAALLADMCAGYGFGEITCRGFRISSAADLRAQRVERARLCAVLECPIDSCFTTCELARDANRENWHGPWHGFHEPAAFAGTK